MIASKIRPDRLNVLQSQHFFQMVSLFSSFMTRTNVRSPITLKSTTSKLYNFKTFSYNEEGLVHLKRLLLTKCFLSFSFPKMYLFN